MLLQKIETATITTYALDITTEKYPDECFYLDVVEGAILEAYLHSSDRNVKELICCDTYSNRNAEQFPNYAAGFITVKTLNDYCSKYSPDDEEE